MKNSIIIVKLYIDWKRGNPYIFKNKDFDDLINSNLLWARKFDERIDNQIIQRIYEYLSDKKKREEF